MTIEEAILEKVRMLPPEKQHEVLDFTECSCRPARHRTYRASRFGALEGSGRRD